MFLKLCENMVQLTLLIFFSSLTSIVLSLKRMLGPCPAGLAAQKVMTVPFARSVRGMRLAANFPFDYLWGNNAKNPASLSTVDETEAQNIWWWSRLQARNKSCWSSGVDFRFPYAHDDESEQRKLTQAQGAMMFAYRGDEDEDKTNELEKARAEWRHRYQLANTELKMNVTTRLLASAPRRAC